MDTLKIKQQALQYEALDDPKAAIELYENIMACQQKPDLESIVNLLCIYFEMQDYGQQVHYAISGQYAGQCYEKMLQLISRAQALYPTSLQLQFWSDYTQHIYWGDPPHDVLNENLYTTQTETLDPFFAFDDRYTQQKMALFDQVKDQKTFRERYIASRFKNNMNFTNCGEK